MSAYSYEARAPPGQAPAAYETPYAYDPTTAYVATGLRDAPPFAAEEEIRTIFITGFPEDVKERELNNMLRFLPGYQVGPRSRAPTTLPVSVGLVVLHRHRKRGGCAVRFLSMPFSLSAVDRRRR